MTEQKYRCSGAPGCGDAGCSAFSPRRYIPHGANPPPWNCKSAGGMVHPEPFPPPAIPEALPEAAAQPAADAQPSPGVLVAVEAFVARVEQRERDDCTNALHPFYDAMMAELREMRAALAPFKEAE